jgi:TonB family protein
MKYVSSIIFIIVVSAHLSIQISAQSPSETQDKDWMRVRTDDGEFSIEVPTNHKYYFNDEGFRNGNENQYFLKDMVLVNAYKDGTLLSVEKYQAKKGALDEIYASDTGGRKNLEKTESKRDGYLIREVVQKSDASYMVRRYIYSKTQIFIITAGSRSGVTSVMRRFLDSMVFTPGNAQAVQDGTVPFSAMKIDDITVDLKLQDINPTVKSAGASPPSPSPKPAGPGSLTILNKPRASYTDDAKSHRIVGTVVLRINLTSDGFISHIDVLKALPDGLLRQCMLAAVRMKFLPKETDGQPVSIEKTVEYSFDIY